MNKRIGLVVVLVALVVMVMAVSAWSLLTAEKGCKQVIWRDVVTADFMQARGNWRLMGETVTHEAGQFKMRCEYRLK